MSKLSISFAEPPEARQRPPGRIGRAVRRALGWGVAFAAVFVACAVLGR